MEQGKFGFGAWGSEMLGQRIKTAAKILFIRNVAGIAISASAFTLIFLKLSAEIYAPIVQSQLLIGYAIVIGGLGLDAVIIRSGVSIKISELRMIYFVHFFGAGLAIIIAILILLITSDISENVAITMAAAYFVKSLSTIPTAQLESKLEFKVQAVSEFTSQLANFIALASLLPFWPTAQSVAISILINHCVYTAGILSGCRFMPSLPKFKDVFGYVKQGVSIQYNNWIWLFRDASIPVLLKSQGMEAALGSFGLANQFAQKVGVIRQIAWKIAVPATALEKRPQERADGIAKGSKLLIAIICPAFLVSASVIYFLEYKNPVRWSGLLAAFSAVGVHIILNSAFTLQCAGLMADGSFRRLAAFHTVFVVIFCTSLLAFSSMHLPLALLFAELIAALAYSVLSFTSPQRTAGTEGTAVPIDALTGCAGLAVAPLMHSVVPLLLALLLVVIANRNLAAGAAREIWLRTFKSKTK